MSTSNRKIFNKFLTLINDRTLCSLISDEDMTTLIETFLNESASVRFKKCKKDLTDKEDSDFYRQEFAGNGILTTFTISQYPTNPNVDSIEMVCLVNGNPTTFTFNDSTLVFTLSPAPTGIVTCGYDFIGQMNENLDDEEMWILAWGMISSWNSDKVYNESKLKVKLTTLDYKTFSPANLLDKLIELRRRSLIEIRDLTVSYSFNDFTGFN